MSNRVTPTDIGVENQAQQLDEILDKLTDSSDEDTAAEPLSVSQLDIFRCARTGDLNGLKALLKQPNVLEKIDKLGDTGMNPLHLAARFDQHLAVQLLLEEGHACVSAVDEDNATALHYAARKKQTDHSDQTREVISCLIKHGASVNAKDQYDSTPLHFAAMRGNEVVAEALLQIHSISKDKEDHMKATPLLEAVTYNQVGVARLLLENKCQVMTQDSEGSTALHLASMNEADVEMVETIMEFVPLKDQKEFLDQRDHDDNTALHLAVESKNLEIAKFLLEKGADPNAICRVSSSASSALHLACTAGDPDIAALLIKHGAKADIRDKNMVLPLHVAFRNAEVVKLLLKKKSSKVLLEGRDDEMYTPLLTASCYDNPDVVKCLLEHGADIMATEDEDRSALYLASENDQLENVKVLIEHVTGKERRKMLNASDRYDNSPLHVAAMNGFTDIVKSLLQAGARHDTKNEEEETPFLLAAANGHEKVCRVFITKTKGKCVTDEDEDSQTGLHLACHQGHLDVVELLLAERADKDARDCKSWTPLDYAAAAGHVDIVKVLLEEEVPVDAIDKLKTTPLHHAASNGHVDVVKILLDNKADISIADNSGKTALDMAIEKGKEDVAVAIVQSNNWREAMLHDCRNTGGIKKRKKLRSTPFRNMIHRMPDVAKLVLDKCIRTKNVSQEDPRFWVEFNFELVDDTLSKWNKETGKENIAFQDDLYDRKGIPNDYAKPWTANSTAVKENHPLMLMVKYEQESLLTHPVVLALIRRKWKIASVFYFTFLIYYCILLGFLSAFVIEAIPPYNEDVFYNMTQCETGELGNLKSDFEVLASYVIIILALVGIIFEGFQLLATRSKYVSTVVNLFDWFTYVSSILIVVDLTECGLRTDWQWQLSAFCIFIAWIDLLLFLRRLPGVGIYVVMIVQILSTFMQFFIVFFLFIVAFSLSFYVLLRNQSAFASPFYSLMKTWVMMIGEMDFTEIFHEHEDNDAHDAQLFYEESAYAIFIVFLIIMAIIIMNLLTGLAVDDVNALQEKARLKKLTMQVELALDVEVALPASMRRWKQSIVQTERVWPYKRKGWTRDVLQVFSVITDGHDLSQKRYVHMALNDNDPADDDRDREIKDLEHNLKKMMEAHQRATDKRLQAIENLLKPTDKPRRLH